MKKPTNKLSLEQAIMNNTLTAWRAQKRHQHLTQARRGHRNRSPRTLHALDISLATILGLIILAIIELLTK